MMSNKWTITGRVCPERVDVNFGPIGVNFQNDIGTVIGKITSKRSFMHVSLEYEYDEMNWVNAVEICSEITSPILDFIAFQNRGYYFYIWDMAINENGDTFMECTPGMRQWK